jgi:prepilin-type N-terminal cleavage/methylation domain-containing protein
VSAGVAAGFTLLELLTVVIIVAILAMVALPQYVRTTERARVTQVLPLLSAIRDSEVRFRAQHPADVYTTDLGETSGLDASPFPAIPTAWQAPPTVSGTGAGADVCLTRTASGELLMVDLDTGKVCASASGAADWGLPAASGGCGSCS